MRVLVVDDDRGVRDLVARALGDEGFDVATAPDGESAIGLARERPVDLVFCDVRMGTMSGFDVLETFKSELESDAEIVLMTGQASAEAALDAVCAGARDYIVKPFAIGDLIAMAHSTAARRRVSPLAAPPPAVEFGDVIGRSAAMIEVFKTVGRVAATDLPILILGESGTGKEVIARTIHARSHRRDRRFDAINCGALTETLLDSELFGYVRGAFTGAASDRKGLFEEANGGTLLLDEITETSAAFQVKLLRVLQESEIRRVGANATVKIDVRVLATSNRDLDAAVAEGVFRKDLLYRLNAVTISVPPLRERAGDIELMVAAFLKHFRKPGAPPVRITAAASERLKAYEWPGNVRELRQTIHRMVALNSDGVVGVEDLPPQVRASTAELDVLLERADRRAPGQSREWLTLDALSGQYLLRVLNHTGGNAKLAAELLGIDRKTLARMAERESIDVDAIRRNARAEANE